MDEAGSYDLHAWQPHDQDPTRLADVSGSGVLHAAPSLSGQLHSLRVYDRCLRTSEAVGNFRAGPEAWQCKMI